MGKLCKYVRTIMTVRVNRERYSTKKLAHIVYSLKEIQPNHNKSLHFQCGP